MIDNKYYTYLRCFRCNTIIKKRSSIFAILDAYDHSNTHRIIVNDNTYILCKSCHKSSSKMVKKHNKYKNKELKNWLFNWIGGK